MDVGPQFKNKCQVRRQPPKATGAEGKKKKKAGRSLSQVDFCVCQLNELKSRGRWTWWNPTNAVRRLQDIFVCFSQQLAAVTTFIHHWPTCKWPAHDESAAFRVASPTVSIGRRLQGGISSALAARCPTSVCKTKPQPKITPDHVVYCQIGPQIIIRQRENWRWKKMKNFG